MDIFLARELPDSFTHLRQSLPFLKGSFTEKYRSIVGGSGAIGVRFSVWLFAVEYFTGDVVPESETFKGLRLIIWDRILNNSKPKQWHQATQGFRLSSCAVLDLSLEEYWKDWTKTLKQYRNKWETQTEYEIEKVARNQFVDCYLKFGHPKNLLSASINSLDRHIKENRSAISLFILKNKITNTVVAGVGVVDAKEVNQSYYLTAFTDKKIAPPQAGLWLLNNWFLQCIKNGIRFANFGVIWVPGQSKGWKGFSEFKLHFRPIILEYKPPLFRFTFSLKKEIGEQII